MPPAADLPSGTPGQIIPAIFFNFLCYITIGVPLAVLPTYAHLQLGFGTILAGLVISTQYVATIFSRPRAGRMTDVLGPKRTVIYGLLICALSGVITLASAYLVHWPRLCLAFLLAGRLSLGLGESLISIGAMMWGIARAGSHNVVKVISWNGVCTYGGLALGAPLGILLAQHGGLVSVGLFTSAVCLSAILLARRLPGVPVMPHEPSPFAHIFRKVALHGSALALGSIGFGILATFVTLFYASRQWEGAVLALSVYGVCFIVARLIFSPFILSRGGFPVAMVSFSVEFVGLVLLGFAHNRSTAFLGAALIGSGFSLIYPALAVEAVRFIPVHMRGSALGTYGVSVDVSLFLTGPIAGAIISRYSYSAAFLAVAAAVLLAISITAFLNSRPSASA
jgi:MFS family permease